MLMTLSGHELISQGDQESQLAPGSVVVWDSETPARFLVQEPLIKRTLLGPKSALSEIGTRGELMTGGSSMPTHPP
jgi:AraC family transcriptional regulator, positive regulator of tynA and feaB